MPKVDHRQVQPLLTKDLSRSIEIRLGSIGNTMNDNYKILTWIYLFHKHKKHSKSLNLSRFFKFKITLERYLIQKWALWIAYLLFLDPQLFSSNFFTGIIEEFFFKDSRDTFQNNSQLVFLYQWRLTYIASDMTCVVFF